MTPSDDFQIAQVQRCRLSSRACFDASVKATQVQQNSRRHARPVDPYVYVRALERQGAPRSHVSPEALSIEIRDGCLQEELTNG
jgi:hypothetical protein